MRLLLTNDDGIDAPGLEALARAAEGLAELVVVAPTSERSGCSHSATTHAPLKLEQRGPNRYALDGTPADCVRVALHRLGEPFDAVLAGINSGGNLGVDVFHSGTVAAVREGAIHGLPGIAVSRYRSRSLEPADWLRAAEWTRPLLADLLDRFERETVIWNINLPCLAATADAPQTARCELDVSPLGVEFREEEGLLHYAGVYAERPRIEGRDVDVCFGGRIALTRLTLTP
ncbi:MAG: 5'/3'-nucleotidase SurE [Bryobacterales bacterium]|nr:5'/3'-nucleotidase SurE [Acidobacteriota bacterium]MCB9384483.1 5'/3'-nucleotidase SurE [Bryobacterales bacterium]